jgi:hypothetical protein
MRRFVCAVCIAALGCEGAGEGDDSAADTIESRCEEVMAVVGAKFVECRVIVGEDTLYTDALFEATRRGLVETCVDGATPAMATASDDEWRRCTAGLAVPSCDSICGQVDLPDPLACYDFFKQDDDDDDDDEPTRCAAE